MIGSPKNVLFAPFSDPNAKIFEEYGLLSDPNSIMAKSEVLCIRHGCSKFNKFSKQISDEFKIKKPRDTGDGLKKLHIKEFSDYIKNDFLLDSLLHEEGHDQALDQQELINKFHFLRFLVSPHRRTI